MTADQSRQTYLLPADDSLLRIGDLSATPPTNVVDLPARIGFLGVNADLTGLSLEATGNDPAVQLVRADDAGGPLRISQLLTDDGALRPELLEVRSNVTAGIAFTATERPLVPLGTQYASGVDGPASGEASVSWGPQGLPSVTFGAGYEDLRAFDPVPAAFLSGTARVTTGTSGAADTVAVDVTLPAGTTLHDRLGVAPPSSGAPAVEVARRLVATGLACQNVTLVDADTLSCEGLAPNGRAGLTQGQAVELIVLGDPFALRDSVLEGLSATLSSFDQLAADNRDEGLPERPVHLHAAARRPHSRPAGGRARGSRAGPGRHGQGRGRGRGRRARGAALGLERAGVPPRRAPAGEGRRQERVVRPDSWTSRWATSSASACRPAHRPRRPWTRRCASPSRARVRWAARPTSRWAWCPRRPWPSTSTPRPRARPCRPRPAPGPRRPSAWTAPRSAASC